jgi:hypothetical protein
VNTAKQTGWARIFGVYSGAPNPIMQNQLTRNPQTGHLPQLPDGSSLVVSIDKCPACLAKLDAATIETLQNDTAKLTSNRAAMTSQPANPASAPSMGTK